MGWLVGQGGWLVRHGVAGVDMGWLVRHGVAGVDGHTSTAWVGEPPTDGRPAKLGATQATRQLPARCLVERGLDQRQQRVGVVGFADIEFAPGGPRLADNVGAILAAHHDHRSAASI